MSASPSSAPARSGYFAQGLLGRDLLASVVVFLVALPLCMGIAIASGMPPASGLITGIVGGLLVGLIAGSPLQVSGPAAGLAVLVFELVRQHGVAALGPVILLAGLIQLVAGLCRAGVWFRMTSPAVVAGMLSGIGILIVASQSHVLMDASPKARGLENFAALPAVLWQAVTGGAGSAALLVGLGTIAIMLGWEKLRPAKLRFVPGALLAVVGVTAAVQLMGIDVKKVDVPANLLSAVSMPSLADLGGLLDTTLLVSALTFAFIASAETLLSAAAVDRMHTGARTQYDRELAAQGVGNMVCGFLGALPMTGVIVRSAANVQANAATRASTILHACWLLVFAMLVPWLLRLSLHSSRLKVDVHEPEGEGNRLVLSLDGSATFLRVPEMARTLERVPPGRELHVDVSRLRHVDHACLELLRDFARNAASRGNELVVDWQALGKRTEGTGPSRVGLKPA